MTLKLCTTASWALTALLAVNLLAGCSGNEQDSDANITPETIVIDGSSTVYPISKEAAKRYESTESKADINVSFSGTTAGFRRFCSGETDISDASRAINAEEKAACAEQGIDYIELPLAKDLLAIVVHPKNRWLESISIEQLKTIWSPESEGKIMQWSDVNPEWPEEEIKLFGRGQDSGTYDYFTTEVTGETRSSRQDYTASEDEEFLAAEIAKDKNSLGFFGIGAYHRHWDTLRLVPVDSGNGPVYPSIETASEGTYTPFTRPLYLYVKQASLQEKPYLKPFLKHYYSNLNQWIHFTGYLPLSEAKYKQALQTLNSDASASDADKAAKPTASAADS